MLFVLGEARVGASRSAIAWKRWRKLSLACSRSITVPLPWEFWTSACGDSTPCLHRLKVHLCFGCHGMSS